MILYIIRNRTLSISTSYYWHTVSLILVWLAIFWARGGGNTLRCQFLAVVCFSRRTRWRVGDCHSSDWRRGVDSSVCRQSSRPGSHVTSLLNFCQITLAFVSLLFQCMLCSVTPMHLTVMINNTRKPCCRKETARCRKCSFPLKFANINTTSIRLAKLRKRPRFRAPNMLAQNTI